MKKRVVTAKNQYPEVLIVEDQVICRKILCAQLSSLGYQVDIALASRYSHEKFWPSWPQN